MKNHKIKFHKWLTNFLRQSAVPFSPQERDLMQESDFRSDTKRVSLGKTDDGVDNHALVNNLCEKDNFYLKIQIFIKIMRNL